MNIQRKFTQDNITEISETEVFVFGSNENGNHAGGAAKQAVEEFGAIEGVAEGLQGKSYAIPTLTKSMEKRTLEQISESVKQFYEFAEENAHLDFIVTKIGCGIAGFKVEEIARIFKAIDFIPFNVTLPMEFTAICGVKGFGKDLYCSKYSKGKQYAENSTFTEPYDLACYKGMHYCENPLDVLRFYTEEFAEVKGEGVIDTKNSDSKVACSTLHVGAKIDFSSVIKLGIDFTLRKTKFLTKKANSEESTAVANR